MRKFLIALVPFGFLFASGNIQAAEKPADPDEALLRENGIATDDAGLRKYVRDCAEYDAKVRRIPDLIKQLGSKDFQEREKASADLTAVGRAALPALWKATEHKDAEVSRRAKKHVEDLYARDEITALESCDKETIVFCLWSKVAEELFSCATREVALRFMLKRGKGQLLTAAFVDCLQSPDNPFFFVTRIPARNRDLHVFHMAKDLLEAVYRPPYDLRQPALFNRQWSVSELQSLRPNVRAVMDALYRAADGLDADGRALARQALNRLGREKSAAACKDFQHANDASKRLSAVSRLGCLLLAKEEAPVLLQAFKDKDNALREAAVNKLGRMVLRPELVVPALVAGLHDDCKELRVKAAAALGSIGPEAKAAIPALLRTLKKGDGDLRATSAASLGWIGPLDPGVVPSLIEALRDPQVRIAAMWGISLIGPAAKAAVPALVEIARNPGPEKPWEPRVGAAPSALAAIGSIGREAKEAVPALVDLLGDERTNIEVRDVVGWALGHIGPAAAPAVPILLKLLRENRKDYLDPEKILRILGEIGPAARLAVPDLIAIGKDSQGPPQLRSAAAEVLEKINPGSTKKSQGK